MKFFSIALLLALSSSAWAAADPQLLGLLMPEAKVVAGVQLDQAKASPFGQFILQQAGPNADLDKLKAATGFDPRTDLTEIVAGSGIDGKSLVVGRGAFQPASLTNLATTSGSPTENYRGVTLIGAVSGMAPNSKGGAVAFLDGSTVVIGDRDLVKGAVDRWLTSGSSNGIAARVAEVSASSQAWAVATGISELPGTAPANQNQEAAMVQNILAKIDQLSGGLTFGDTVTVHGQALAKNPQDAQALADVFQFLIAMGGQKSPLPSTPQFTVSGSAVNFVLSISEQQLEDLLRPKIAPVRAARLRR